MDICLSSSSMLSVMVEKGLIVKGVSKSQGLLSHGAHLGGGSITYVWSIMRLIASLVSGGGNSVTTGSIKRLAEVTKVVGLNVVANIIPLIIDSRNSAFMLSANPQNSLNVKCYVD